MEELGCVGRLITTKWIIQPEFLIVILSLKIVDDDEIKTSVLYSSFAFSPSLDWEGDAKLA